MKSFHFFLSHFSVVLQDIYMYTEALPSSCKRGVSSEMFYFTLSWSLHQLRTLRTPFLCSIFLSFIRVQILYITPALSRMSWCVYHMIKGGANGKILMNPQLSKLWNTEMICSEIELYWIWKWLDIGLSHCYARGNSFDQNWNRLQE